MFRLGGKLSWKINLKRSYPSPYFKLSIILIRNWVSPSFEIDPISNWQVTPIFIRNWPCCEMIVNRQKYTFMKNHTLILIKYYDRMLSVERSWTFRKWSNNFSLRIVLLDSNRLRSMFLVSNIIIRDRQKLLVHRPGPGPRTFLKSRTNSDQDQIC